MADAFSGCLRGAVKAALLVVVTVLISNAVASDVSVELIDEGYDFLPNMVREMPPAAPASVPKPKPRQKRPQAASNPLQRFVSRLESAHAAEQEKHQLERVSEQFSKSKVQEKQKLAAEAQLLKAQRVKARQMKRKIQQLEARNHPDSNEAESKHTRSLPKRSQASGVQKSAEHAAERRNRAAPMEHGQGAAVGSVKAAAQKEDSEAPPLDGLSESDAKAAQNDASVRSSDQSNIVYDVAAAEETAEKAENEMLEEAAERFELGQSNDDDDDDATHAKQPTHESRVYLKKSVFENSVAHTQLQQYEQQVQQDELLANQALTPAARLKAQVKARIASATAQAASKYMASHGLDLEELSLLDMSPADADLTAQLAEMKTLSTQLEDTIKQKSARIMAAQKKLLPLMSALKALSADHKAIQQNGQHIVESASMMLSEEMGESASLSSQKHSGHPADTNALLELSEGQAKEDHELDHHLAAREARIESEVKSLGKEQDRIVRAAQAKEKAKKQKQAEAKAAALKQAQQQKERADKTKKQAKEKANKTKKQAKETAKKNLEAKEDHELDDLAAQEAQIVKSLGEEQDRIAHAAEKAEKAKKQEQAEAKAAALKQAQQQKERADKTKKKQAKERAKKNQASQVYNAKLLSEEARLRMTTAAQVDAESHLAAALEAKRRHDAQVMKTSEPITALNSEQLNREMYKRMYLQNTLEQVSQTKIDLHSKLRSIRDSDEQQLKQALLTVEDKKAQFKQDLADTEKLREAMEEDQELGESLESSQPLKALETIHAKSQDATKMEEKLATGASVMRSQLQRIQGYNTGVVDLATKLLKNVDASRKMSSSSNLLSAAGSSQMKMQLQLEKVEQLNKKAQQIEAAVGEMQALVQQASGHEAVAKSKISHVSAELQKVNSDVKHQHAAMENFKSELGESKHTFHPIALPKVHLKLVDRNHKEEENTRLGESQNAKLKAKAPIQAQLSWEQEQLTEAQSQLEQLKLDSPELVKKQQQADQQELDNVMKVAQDDLGHMAKQFQDAAQSVSPSITSSETLAQAIREEQDHSDSYLDALSMAQQGVQQANADESKASRAVRAAIAKVEGVSP